MAGATRASRACDGCRIRKVKCDGANPCSQCVHFDVACVVSPPSKRKNPIRGRLVAKVRGEENNFSWAKDTSTSPASPDDARTSRSDHLSPTSGNFVASRGFSLDHTVTPAAYPASFFTNLIPRFEATVYPLSPIISPEEMLSAIANMENSIEDAALVYSFGATTMFLTQAANTIPGAVSHQMNELIQLSLEAHKRTDLRLGTDGKLVEEPLVSLKRVMTCIFLEISMMAFSRFDRSFALLREAITMLQTLKAHQFSPSGSESCKFQRLYWEAYVHERFLTISSGYPSVLPRLNTGLPAHDPTLPLNVQLGFNRIISLFLVMDRPFLAYWAEEEFHDDTIPDITIQWIESKQAQLDDDEADAEQANHNLRVTGQTPLTEMQSSDLYVSRLWLRTILWQMALSRGLLRSGPLQDAHEGLSLHFPVQRLSTQLRNLVGHLESVTSISTQGSGILQKLFEITSTIGDVLALPIGLHQTGLDMTAQVQDFVFIAKFLFNLDHVREQQKQYLMEKVESLQQQYPTIVDLGIS